MVSAEGGRSVPQMSLSQRRASASSPRALRSRSLNRLSSSAPPAQLVHPILEGTFQPGSRDLGLRRCAANPAAGWFPASHGCRHAQWPPNPDTHCHTAVKIRSALRLLLHSLGICSKCTHRSLKAQR